MNTPISLLVFYLRFLVSQFSYFLLVELCIFFPIFFVILVLLLHHFVIKMDAVTLQQDRREIILKIDDLQIQRNNCTTNNKSL